MLVCHRLEFQKEMCTDTQTDRREYVRGGVKKWTLHGDLMQNNESLKQQCLNQLIGQQRVGGEEEEEARCQATSHNPQRNNRRGQ